MQISIDDMKEAIQRSGYPLEQRVERTLREGGYYVQTSAAYPDERREGEYPFAYSPFDLLHLDRRSPA